MADFKGYIYKFTSTIDPIKCYIGKTFHIGSGLNDHLTGRGNTSFYNINKVNITKCCLGKYKTSIGYIWKYKEE